MAIDKIIIEVTGDAKGVDKTIDQLEKVGKVDKENAAQFEKHNKQFQKAVGESSKAVNSHVESLKSLVPAVTAAFAVQTVIAFGKASLNAFIEAERGEKLLLNALGKNEAAFKRLTEAAKKYQATTVYDDDTIIAAQTFLATQGRTEEQINKVIKAATNLSAVTGDSLQSSVEKLDATYEGSIGRFGKLDSRLKTLTLTQLENGAAVDLLAEKYAGFAEAELETTAGKVKQLQNQFGELQESLGESILLGAAPIFKDIASEIDHTNTALTELAQSFGFANNEGEKFNVISFLITNVIKGLSEPFRALNWLIQKNAEAYDWVVKKLGLAKEQHETLAQLVARNQKEIDANNEKNKQSSEEVTKANETQVKTLASLAATIEKLKRELVIIPLETKEWTDKNNELTAAQKELDKYTKKATDAIKEQKKELDKPTKIDDSLGGTLDVSDYEARQQQITDLQQAGADEATRIKAEEVAERLRLDDILAENEKKNQEEVTANLEAEARRRQQIEQALQQAVSQLVTMAIDYQLSLSQKATDYELDLLQDRFDAKKITEEQYNSQRRAILKDQAQKQKEAAIIKATIDTANAVINAFSEGGPVLAAIAGAVGIAQLAIISATPIPEFEKGGRIGGKRHRDGGTPLIAEKDEFIINRKAASKIGFDNLEMLNRGIVPVKLLKQGISESRDKKMENTLKAVFGSNDFDTYPIEKELRKNRKHDTELTHLLIKNLKQGSRKRGGY